jgi:hypothetical protein
VNAPSVDSCDNEKPPPPSGMPAQCPLCIRVYPSPVPPAVTRILFVFKSSPAVGQCPLTMNVLRPESGGPSQGPEPSNLMAVSSRSS